jgi:cytidyltransferase-like protein
MNPLNPQNGDIADVGVIHGRFQILHNDHLKYLMAGKEKCRHLVVGITNPDPMLTREENAAPERSDPKKNPLTYYERQHLIRGAFKEYGLPHEDYTIVPFPVNFPDMYRYYVPMDALFFLTIYDDWGKRKKEYFSNMGLKIHVLWEVPPEKKGISSSDIRTKMAKDLPWSHLVPKSVAELLLLWDIPGRIKS